jgi:hypothetical protein
MSLSWLFSVHQKTQAPLVGCAVQLIAIHWRMQSVEITERAPRAAQHHRRLLCTKNPAKRAIVPDLFVTDEAFLRRGIPAMHSPIP